MPANVRRVSTVGGGTSILRGCMDVGLSVHVVWCGVRRSPRRCRSELIK
jgi:hypothetical protein